MKFLSLATALLLITGEASAKSKLTKQVFAKNLVGNGIATAAGSKILQGLKEDKG